MPTVLITGANRGLGLEAVRQYAADGWQVIACCRAPDSATELAQLAGSAAADIRVLSLEVTDSRQIAALRDRLQQQPIDVLFLNAGVYGQLPQDLQALSVDNWLNTLHINSIAPIMLAAALCENVAASEQKKIALLTSKMGSISDNGSGGLYCYRSSKAALNAAAKSLALDVESEGVSVAILHPGWVLTDMGGPNALIDAATSVGGLRQVLKHFSLQQSGGFFDYAGNVIDW